MKKTTLFFFGIWSLLSHTTAQLNITVPEFKNTIKLVDTIKNELNDVERVNAAFDSKLKDFGYGGHNTYLKLPGKESSVSIQAMQTVFVVKLPDTDTDPSTYIELYKFKVETDRRTLLIGSRQLYGKSRNVDIPKVGLKFSKISPACYLITLPQNLAQGNYGFVIDATGMREGNAWVGKASATVFAFDVK